MRSRRSLSLALLALALTGAVMASAAGPPATVWLCRPGVANDPCIPDGATSVVSAKGATVEARAAPPSNPRFDCFYVYPTVSVESSVNADLRIQPAERAVAQAQASQFSRLCRVWAPMYRQETLAGLFTAGVKGSAAAENTAYSSLLAAWTDYLAHDNGGRPIIFIGHSQGAAMLIRLLASQVDGDAALRAPMVVAVILGGNVEVASGKDVGGSFRRLPGCTSSSEVGCVIAYSSFPSQPPADSLFGIPGQGVSLQSSQTATRGLDVLCVNPAALGGGAAPLQPLFPAAALAGASSLSKTPWVTFPSLYTGQCRHAGDATWLQVTDVGTRSDRRPRISEVDGPQWGFHTDDVNVALGNLLVDVAAEEAAYQHAHPAR